MSKDELAFRCQNRAFRLSVLLSAVRSLASKHCARASKCSRPPANSKSEFEMEPLGLVLETS